MLIVEKAGQPSIQAPAKILEISGQVLTMRGYFWKKALGGVRKEKSRGEGSSRSRNDTLRLRFIVR